MVRVRWRDCGLNLGRRVRGSDGGAVLANRRLARWPDRRGRGRGGCGGAPGRAGPAGLGGRRHGDRQQAQNGGPRYREATLGATCLAHPTALLCRPAGLAVGLALKEPAPPLSTAVGSPQYLVPPLPSPRGDGTRRNWRGTLPNVKEPLQSTSVR